MAMERGDLITLIIISLAAIIREERMAILYKNEMTPQVFMSIEKEVCLKISKLLKNKFVTLLLFSKKPKKI
jgi:hypothetical protein